MNHRKGIFFAIIASLTFIVATFMLGQVDAKNGLESLYPQSLGCIFIWVAYHSIKFVEYKWIQSKSTSPGIQAPKSPNYISKANSPYFTKRRMVEKFRFNWAAFFVPIFRGMLSGFIQIILALTFGFAAKSEVNAGIIASVFSSCVIFTPIIFHVIKRKRMSSSDVVGGMFIIKCIILIGAGPMIFSSQEYLAQKEDSQ